MKLARPTKKNVTKATAKQRMLKQLLCTDAPEQALRYHGFRSIAGVDEVGRGALFGPVVAAAVSRVEARIPDMIKATGATPEALQRTLLFEIDRWAPIIKTAGVYAD